MIFKHPLGCFFVCANFTEINNKIHEAYANTSQNRLFTYNQPMTLYGTNS